MDQEALGLYSSMQQENLNPNYVGLLQACATVGVSDILEGKQVERQGPKEDAVWAVLL